MPGLRERIAEALGYPSFLSDDVKRVDVDRVMAVVQRDLDELEAAVADAQLALLDARSRREGGAMTVPPEIKRLRGESERARLWAAAGDERLLVLLSDAEQAVRDADARARREERERLASDAAIERVAIALMEVSEYTYDEKWSEIPKSRRKDWRSRARAVLSAALAEQGEPDDA